ncbi:hypothetical protein SD78_3119 [Bacillus badius]|nr:hypothetical protein SD78_3119 [Bacillus badius]
MSALPVFICWQHGVIAWTTKQGGILMWIAASIFIVLLFGYLGHALLHPENY